MESTNGESCACDGIGFFIEVLSQSTPPQFLEGTQILTPEFTQWQQKKLSYIGLDFFLAHTLDYIMAQIVRYSTSTTAWSALE